MAINTRLEKDGDILVIEAPRRLGADVAGELREILKRAVEDGIYRLVVDLSRTETVDSTGLGAMVSRIALARSNGGDVRLAAPNSFVRNLLQITHLDQVFKDYSDTASAVASFDDKRSA
ncbi:MAG: STAS domain-containing protein [Desulfatibacillaceae bacterium]